MLTKDMINCRCTGREIRPSFIPLDDAAALESARELLDVYCRCKEATRSQIEELVEPVVMAADNPKAAKGLAKLTEDLAVYSAREDVDFTAQRLRLFAISASVLRHENWPEEEEYLRLIREQAGKPSLLDDGQLYADLPEYDRLLNFPELTPPQLLARYNCALVQALLFFADTMTLTIRGEEPARLRRLFKYLKFFRLLARLYEGKCSDELKLVIEGPGSLFTQGKRYGMQLACFFPAVCTLRQWTMEAEVEWKEKRRLLRLDQTTGLSSHYHVYSAYVPEEIKMFHNYFKEKVKDWSILEQTSFLKGRKGELIFPDLSFRSPKGMVVHLELFHKWHARPLQERLEFMDSQPDFPLLIGVDRSLLAEAGLEERLKATPWFDKKGFLFKDYPTVDKTLRCLAAFL